MNNLFLSLFRSLFFSLFLCSLNISWGQSLDIYQDIGIRNLSPAKTGGRVVDIAIDPNNKNIRYVAVASGNVWKTVNAGTTWQPIFDNYGSFSIGVVEVDPNDSNIIWVGTGENNSQRSVSMGDGVYKSIDGGKSFQNMGLKTSEHIGKIVIHPQNSDIVYVAAQGPLWADGGERGLYRTKDGGKTWVRILHVSEKTGISDIIMNPDNPEILLTSSYQRRRHVGKLVAGGPDGGIWKSTNGGTTWFKLSKGLPKGDIGRIGLAFSPIDPDITYALIAGDETGKGFYRSSDQGETWQKMNDYMVIDAQYYMELFPDPHKLDRVYVVDVRIHVTEDGGKTFGLLPENRKHVDSHEIIFDKDDPAYIMVGCDGGIYETWDRGKTWRFTDNIPISQFYRVGIDNAEPFYHVYGGTQDNNTIGGPSRTVKSNGISNADWYFTLGGDGFQARIDPEDPNTVYCMSQYAGIVRFDKKTGEKIDIQPQPRPGEPPLRWHWDSPLIISPHNSKRLYFAANKLFRSDDRGNTWEEISGDLSRQLDRNKMKVMDRVWGIDAIFKNVWTSPYGTIVSLDESPVQEGLIYAGTDDGLIQVTENGGSKWQKYDRFSGVPENSYLADIFASRHDAHTVFAVFNNHKEGDFKPYFFKSTNKGKSWTSISSNLPENAFGWSIVQDHVNKDLLFAGTEYGLFYSQDGGKSWVKFKKGIPTIAIRDVEIQARENDLVAASFGRGFYIIDDYSPLRVNKISSDSYLFPVKDALQFIPVNPEGRALGHEFFTSPNPAYGAVFTYYLKSSTETLKQKRKKEEKERIEKSQPVYYPDWDDFTAENRESKPQMLFTIFDEEGNFIKRISGPATKGLHRIAWDLRYGTNGGYGIGPLVAPGHYQVKIGMIVNGEWKDLEQQQSFAVKSLAPLPDKEINEKQRVAFHLEVMNTGKEIKVFNETLQKAIKELASIERKIISSTSDGKDLLKLANTIHHKLRDFDLELNGNSLITANMELIPPTISGRVNRIMYTFWNTRSEPTQTQRQSLADAQMSFASLKSGYNALLNGELKRLVTGLKKEGIPFSTAWGDGF